MENKKTTFKAHIVRGQLVYDAKDFLEMGDQELVILDKGFFDFLVDATPYPIQGPNSKEHTNTGFKPK